jgi:hypothetical protein
MLKKIAFFMTVLLMASSMATSVTVADPILPGSVHQVQTFSIGDTSQTGMGIVLNLTHGDAHAAGVQSLDIDNVQSSPCGATPCWDCSFFSSSCDVEAAQTQSAEMDQDASACGDCGIINVSSFLDAAGEQEQFIGFSTDMKSQVQGLGVAAQQVLNRSDGAGGANSTNDALLSQEQAGSNAAGSAYESSTIDAYQDNNTYGKANSTTALATSLIATTSQAQMVY